MLRNLSLFMSSILLFVTTGIASAGITIGPTYDFSLVSLDCDEITVEVSGDITFSDTRVNIDIVNVTPTAPFTPGFDEEIFPAGNAISYTTSFTFTGGLDAVTEISVSVEMRTPGADFPFFEDTLTATIDCTESGGGMLISTDDAPPFGCNDGRLNQTQCEPLAIYTVESDEGIGLSLWEIDRETGLGSFSLYVAAETLSATLEAGTDVFCQIAVSTDERTGIYLLPNGQFIVVHGPDFEQKFFIFTFDTFPSIPTPSTAIATSLPPAPAC